MLRRGATLTLALLAACSSWRPAPPPSEPIPAVALLPIYDRVERSAFSGVFMYYSWIAETRAAVPELLAGAVRAELARRGIEVVDAGVKIPPGNLAEARADASAPTMQVPMLYIAIDKWEANDSSFPDRVDVALDAALLAPPSGRTLWALPRRAGPIATLGSTSLADAYRRAAEQVAAHLVGAWTPP